MFFRSYKDSTDEEAKDQLLEEIELMKSIGSHRNVVNMLGCWVKSDPIFLLLEYVPYGDLQHWLRKKRMQVSIQEQFRQGYVYNHHLNDNGKKASLLTV